MHDICMVRKKLEKKLKNQTKDWQFSSVSENWNTLLSVFMSVGHKMLVYMIFR